MADGCSEKLTQKLPEWVKPPLRLLYHPLYRWKVRAWCGLSSILDLVDRRSGAGLPIPPPMMRFKVGGTPSRRVFLETGRRSCENLLEVLRSAGRPLEEPRFAKVLDFGCGCARTLVWLAPRFPGKKFWGSDVDSEMIQWCRTHLPQVEFGVNRPRPPTDHAREKFDFIFAISVFTHLDESRQLEWLEEFRRLLSPQGGLLLTVHGETVWATQPAPVREALLRAGTLTTRSRKLQGLHPDWYQTTFHTQDYARRACGRFFDEVTYWPQAMGFHDAVLCFKPRTRGLHK